MKGSRIIPAILARPGIPAFHADFIPTSQRPCRTGAAITTRIARRRPPWRRHAGRTLARREALALGSRVAFRDGERIVVIAPAAQPAVPTTK